VLHRQVRCRKDVPMPAARDDVPNPMHAKQSSRYTALMSRRLMTSKLAIMETTIRIPDNLAGGGLETTARPPRGAT
jgi:hypothetical protein